MADMESVEEVFERHAPKAAELKERIEKHVALERPVREEMHKADKAAVAKDDREGTTEGLLAGDKPGVDMLDPREHCITQERVDHIRAKTTMNTIFDAYVHKDFSVYRQVQHLWFSKDDIRGVAVRDGNPPADVDRPPHLRGVQLVMDYPTAPEPLRHLLRDAAKAFRQRATKKMTPSQRLRRAFQRDARLGEALKAKLGIPHG